MDASRTLFWLRGLEFLINEPNFFKNPAIASQSRGFCLGSNPSTRFKERKQDEDESYPGGGEVRSGN